MIAACPKCGSRYRIERERIEPAGARLRCSRCEVVFRVRPPSEGVAPAAVPSAPRAPEKRAPGPRMLVATPNADLGKETCAALERWGFETALVHDGVEAMLEVQRQLPRAIVVNANLPGMYGFQICEMVKRNESLRRIHVVLIGAIHAADRYRRPPDDLYGADAYLEEPDLPDGLAPILEGLDLPLRRPPRTEPRRRPARPAEAAAPTVAEEAPAPEPAAPPAPPVDDGLGELREEAERLARIIVSDIVLYNAEKFGAALEGGDVAAAMTAELDEGRSLFRERVDERVRREKDHLLEELLRVARLRAGA